ncbi:asparagine synthase (glutamine-hydrolyzing) [bacterium]|nr:asparagine synthase (glutamine-hydrolyzing) [bacterium]
MCGIYGTTKRYDSDTIAKKMAITAYRGPDYTGVKDVGNIILGHNRLSIIDLDPRSNQPFDYMHLSVVFNGEIYNFQDIRETLKKDKFTFLTGSDTEVLCAAYIKYGKECIHHFNGMFAFVIYDAKKNILFGARDRLGQKPFYYTLKDKSFEFASQPSQIALANYLSVDEEAISQYLMWKYIPDPRSIYSEVSKLEAGYRFTYELEARVFKKEQYWDISKTDIYNGSYHQATQELESLIEDAVAKRMIADVPIGVFLSGGVDSSIIAALAQKNSSKKVSTFSIKFDKKGFDESPYASQIAEILGTNHTTIPCDYTEGLALIEKHNTYYDEPFSDSSAIPSMLLAKHTRKHVTVALSGDAGDESFLGYSRYGWMNSVKPVYYFPQGIRKIAGAALGVLPSYKLKLIAEGIQQKDMKALYKETMTSFSHHMLLNPMLGYSQKYESFLTSDKNILEQISDYDLKTYLNGDINTKVDRATMAYALEARSPFLDYRIVEFGRALPTNFKFHKGNKKRILKDILYKHIPKEVMDRPKAGFAIPIAHWFRNELRELMLDTLTQENLEMIPNLNIPYVLNQIERHLKSEVNFAPGIWSLIVLVNWLKKK